MKTQTQHTPGPWHLGVGNGEGYVFGPEGCRLHPGPKGLELWPIAKITPRLPEDDGEDMANARLIAAAPDLLAACEALVKQQATPCESFVDLSQITEIARAALAKARGE